MDAADYVKTLAALLRVDGDCEAVLRGIAGRDWPGLARASAVHRVAPLVFSRIADCGAQEHIPGPDLSVLHGEARAAGAMNTLLLNEHARILETASQRGAALLPLKGAHLITTGIYRADQRPMTDLDYAVRSAHARAASDALQSLGYIEDQPGPGAEFARKYAREYHFTRIVAGAPVAVEVHEALIPSLALRRAFPLDADRLTDHAVPDANGFPAPAPEHALLFSILHFAVTHRFSRLMWLADVDRMCRYFNMDWDVFAHESSAAQAQGAVHAVLHAARVLFGTEPPRKLFDGKNVLSPKLIERRAALWLAGTAPAAEISALPFALCRHPLRALGRHVFPPSDFIALRYGVPPALAPAWSAARPVLLALRSLRASRDKYIP